MLEDGANKEGGSASKGDSDSVLRRFRQEVGSMDKSICIITPKNLPELPILRKISSEVNIEERLMQKQEIGPKTEVKHQESPSTMKKIQA